MTDQKIEKALKDRAYQLSYVDGDMNKGYFITPKDKLSQETLSYIDRLKEACQSAIQSFARMETLYKVKCTELECEKEQIRKDTAKAIIEDFEKHYPIITRFDNFRWISKIKRKYDLEIDE